MSYLFKWQSVSFVSRVIAMLLGIVQSIFIINILSPSDWGTIQVIEGIISIVGTSQAFGLTSGSTREIAGAKTNQEAFKVFLTSLVLRLVISIPFVVYLYIFAPSLAALSSNPDQVVWALRLLAGVLLLQSAQGIFNSVLSGFRKFKILFVYQVVVAFVSVILYIPLVYLYDFQGFYYAYLSFNLVGTFILLYLALANFERPFPKLNLRDVKIVLKDIFAISITIYVVKLIHSLWQRSPILYLNYVLNIDESIIALFGFALLYSTKLLVFSDSITDVTLPVMSKKYTEDIEEFKKSYKSNFVKTFAIITFVSFLAAFWNLEVIRLVIRKPEYSEAASLIPYTILGIWSYSQINLLKSSVFVPAKRLFELILTYSFMLIFTFLLFYLTQSFDFNILLKLAFSFGFGTFFAFVFAILVIKRSLDLLLVDFSEIAYLFLSLLYAGVFFIITDIIAKVGLTFVYAAVSLYYFKYLGILTLLFSRFPINEKFKKLVSKI